MADVRSYRIHKGKILKKGRYRKSMPNFVMLIRPDASDITISCRYRLNTFSATLDSSQMRVRPGMSQLKAKRRRRAKATGGPATMTSGKAQSYFIAT
jgi:hypothetical protein